MEKLDISVANILIKEPARTSDEILTRLGGLLFENHYVKDTFVQAVLDREKIYPTGLQTTTVGIAIPHTDAKHVNRSAVAVATLESPVTFTAMDDENQKIPVSVILMMAVSDPKKVIDTLTKVISILEDKPAMDKIIQAEKKEDIQQAVKDHIEWITEQMAGSEIQYDVEH